VTLECCGHVPSFAVAALPRPNWWNEPRVEAAIVLPDQAVASIDFAFCDVELLAHFLDELCQPKNVAGCTGMRFSEPFKIRRSFAHTCHPKNDRLDHAIAGQQLLRNAFLLKRGVLGHLRSNTLLVIPKRIFRGAFVAPCTFLSYTSPFYSSPSRITSRIKLRIPSSIAAPILRSYAIVYSIQSFQNWPEPHQAPHRIRAALRSALRVAMPRHCRTRFDKNQSERSNACRVGPRIRYDIRLTRGSTPFPLEGGALANTKMGLDRRPDGDWPSLAFDEWKDTYATLHMWTQIVGKIRLMQAPWLNHSWQVTLYLTARGLTTAVMPYATRSFQIDFDFIDHRLVVQTGEGAVETMDLQARPVADFYRELSTSRSTRRPTKSSTRFRSTRTLRMPPTMRSMPTGPGARCGKRIGYSMNSVVALSARAARCIFSGAVSISR
jgi:hypothetical protein